MPRSPRGHVGEGPRRLELQRGLVIQRQEVHEAGQQTSVDDLFKGRVPFLGEQLPVGEGKYSLTTGSSLQSTIMTSGATSPGENRCYKFPAGFSMNGVQ